jgi:hypothetical protein
MAQVTTHIIASKTSLKAHTQVDIQIFVHLLVQIQKMELCYSSWYTNLSAGKGDLTGIDWSTSIMSTVYVWETLKSFGVNSTYKDHADIPRIKFLSQPTRNTNSSFAVTVWEEMLSGGAASYTNSEVHQSKMAHRPQCKFREQEYYYRRLFAMQEVSPDDIEGSSSVPELCMAVFFVLAWIG